jgi:hypothetical protein
MLPNTTPICRSIRSNEHPHGATFRFWCRAGKLPYTPTASKLTISSQRNIFSSVYAICLRSRLPLLPPRHEDTSLSSPGGPSVLSLNSIIFCEMNDARGFQRLKFVASKRMARRDQTFLSRAQIAIYFSCIAHANGQLSSP